MGRPRKNDISNKVIESNSENSDNSLANAFSVFLQDNTKIVSKTNDEIVKIPSGIDLIDAVTDGGIPCKFSVYMGKPGSGKSSLLVSYIKNGQKLWGEKFIAVYCDSEESITQKRFEEFGCKHPVNIVNSLTIEKVFKVLDQLCLFKSQNKEMLEIPSIFVWDSIANTMTEKTIDNEDLSNTDGAVRASIIARLLPKYIDKLVIHNIAMVAVNQYRVKLSMGPTPQAADIRGMKQDQTYPGGQAVGFNAFQMWDVDQGPALKDDPYGYPMAPVKMRAIKNKAFTPNIPIEVMFNHHRGFSNFWTNFEFLKKQKYITPGAHSYLNSLSTVKFRQKNASSLYLENEEWRNNFNEDLKSALADFIRVNSGGDLDAIYWDPEIKTVETEPTTLAWFEKNKNKKINSFIVDDDNLNESENFSLEPQEENEVSLENDSPSTITETSEEGTVFDV